MRRFAENRTRYQKTIKTAKPNHNVASVAPVASLCCRRDDVPPPVATNVYGQNRTDFSAQLMQREKKRAARSYLLVNPFTAQAGRQTTYASGATHPRRTREDLIAQSHRDSTMLSNGVIRASLLLLALLCGAAAKDHKYKAGESVPLLANKVGPFHNPRCAH